jgi:hypothetical protein
VQESKVNSYKPQVNAQFVWGGRAGGRRVQAETAGQSRVTALVTYRLRQQINVKYCAMPRAGLGAVM